MRPGGPRQRCAAAQNSAASRYVREQERVGSRAAVALLNSTNWKLSNLRVGSPSSNSCGVCTRADCALVSARANIQAGRGWMDVGLFRVCLFARARRLELQERSEQEG